MHEEEEVMYKKSVEHKLANYFNKVVDFHLNHTHTCIYIYIYIYISRAVSQTILSKQ